MVFFFLMLNRKYTDIFFSTLFTPESMSAEKSKVLLAERHPLSEKDLERIYRHLEKINAIRIAGAPDVVATGDMDDYETFRKKILSKEERSRRMASQTPARFRLNAPESPPRHLLPPLTGGVKRKWEGKPEASIASKMAKPTSSARS